MTIEEYEIVWHNMIVASSVNEAVQQVQLILEDLKKLEQWEKEEKIRGECMNASPSIQRIVVLDESIEPELKKIGIVGYFELEIEEDEIQ